MYTVSGIAQTPGPPLPDDRNLLNVSKAGQNRSRPDCYWDEGQNDMTPKKSIWVIYIYTHIIYIYIVMFEYNEICPNSFLTHTPEYELLGMIHQLPGVEPLLVMLPRRKWVFIARPSQKSRASWIYVKHCWTLWMAAKSCTSWWFIHVLFNVAKTIISQPFGNGTHNTYLWWWLGDGLWLFWPHFRVSTIPGGDFLETLDWRHHGSQWPRAVPGGSRPRPQWPNGAIMRLAATHGYGSKPL